MLAYSLLLGLGLAVSAPWWLFRMATTSRYREGLPERLGRVPQRLTEAVRDRRVVWVHAVSVGEVLAAARLVGELEDALNRDAISPSWRVVISTTTRTGQALARERFGPDRVFYLPLDFAAPVRSWLRALQPRLVVLAESELWPRLLNECQRQGIPVAVVNARMSDRSFRRAMRLRRLWQGVLGRVTLFLAQSKETAERLSAQGVDPKRVQVSGNLKYDVRQPVSTPLVGKLRELAGDRPVIVAGSTVGDRSLDEDRLVMAAWERAPRQRFNAFLVLAPRHPERFAEVHSAAAGFSTVRASELRAGAALASNQEVEIVVLDTVGDLAAVYALAEIAFVGGSLAPRGGHNPLEPARFGVPVVMGSSFENFREVVSAMQAVGGIEILPAAPPELSGSEKSVWLRDHIEAAMVKLLDDPGAAQQRGQLGWQAFVREGGATGRSINALRRLLDRPDRPAAMRLDA